MYWLTHRITRIGEILARKIFEPIAINTRHRKGTKACKRAYKVFYHDLCPQPDKKPYWYSNFWYNVTAQIAACFHWQYCDKCMNDETRKEIEKEKIKKVDQVLETLIHS